MAPNMHTLFSEKSMHVADKLETWARQKGLTHGVNPVHLAWKIHLQGCLFIVCRWGTIFGSNWCCRFGFETDRGGLTGLDVQIKSPVWGGWGGAASVSREETHLLTLQLGWESGGTGSFYSLLADWVWVREAEGGAAARPGYSSAQRPPCDHILLIGRWAKPSAGLWEGSFMHSFLRPEL